MFGYSVHRGCNSANSVSEFTSNSKGSNIHLTEKEKGYANVEVSLTKNSRAFCEPKGGAFCKFEREISV